MKFTSLILVAKLREDMILGFRSMDVELFKKAFCSTFKVRISPRGKNILL